MTDEQDSDIAARLAALWPMNTPDAFRPPSSTVRVEVGARSHRGNSCLHNDDHYLVLGTGRHQETLATSLSAAELPSRFEEHGYVMLVADGFGQGGAGSVASRVAVSTIAHLALHYGRWNLRIDPKTAAEIIERAEYFYNRVDAAVFARSRTSPLMTGMTTSLTAACSAGHDLFVAHVGHSRAYLFRQGTLSLLTRDDTIERHLADTNRPASVERRAQDLRHILTDALGASGGQPKVEVGHFRLLNDDCVLLCTNGLTDMVSDQRIAEVLALRRQPGELCDILTDLANQAGGEDNITVVLAQYQIPAS